MTKLSIIGVGARTDLQRPANLPKVDQPDAATEKDLQTMSEHTPGPWESYLSTSGRSIEIRVLRHGPDELDKYLPHAEVHNFGSELCDEDRANANLIVAAPDLLGALHDMVIAASKAIAGAKDGQPLEESIVSALVLASETAKGVISKAEGRA